MKKFETYTDGITYIEEEEEEKKEIKTTVLVKKNNEPEPYILIDAYREYLRTSGHVELVIKYEGVKIIQNNIKKSRGTDYTKQQQFTLIKLIQEIDEYEKDNLLLPTKKLLNVDDTPF